MKRITFLEKTKELALYTERYDKVTLFEVSQLYGTALSGFFIFVLSLPLLLIGSQWYALPVGFLIIVLGSLLFFDLRLWMPNSLKAVAMPSKPLQKGLSFLANAIEKVQRCIKRSQFFDTYEDHFQVITALVLMGAGFQIGFVQSPHTSYWTIFALLLLSFDILVDIGYFTFLGYLIFAIGLL